MKTGTGRFPAHFVAEALSGQWRFSAMTDGLVEGPPTGSACAAGGLIVQKTNFTPEPFDVR